jgi:hypothetical protein
MPNHADLLKQALDLRDVATPVDTATYRFSMDNDFVAPTGQVLRRQRMRAGYTRRLSGALSARTALFDFTWNRIEFTSTSTDEAQAASQEPIRWTFAEGRTFEYYRPFPTDRFTVRHEADASPDLKVGDWNADLAQLPAVNLLTLAIWDIVTFEGLSGALACEGLGEYDVLRPIPTMDNTNVHLDFKGYSVEDSTFESGAVLGHPVGVTLLAGTLCAGIAFRGVGRLEVGGVASTHGSQQGESYFLGNCYLSMENADLISSEMTEILMVSMKNKSGKHIPMQKRRVVRITREN